ncbi:hypothetical protein B5V02_07390 [Mesorhizobium kowhaii]|uniref:Uncharacterized protein n=1 Tax=Mesorhizobium kowhaii TaxID=1300272 RepID=A0A2W7C9Y5_9HYPH|nr:hypothetical protein B5V02_07390 [Mesorhizobium kowhaii]
MRFLLYRFGTVLYGRRAWDVARTLDEFCESVGKGRKHGHDDEQSNAHAGSYFIIVLPDARTEPVPFPRSSKCHRAQCFAIHVLAV